MAVLVREPQAGAQRHLSAHDAVAAVEVRGLRTNMRSHRVLPYHRVVVAILSACTHSTHTDKQVMKLGKLG